MLVIASDGEALQRGPWRYLPKNFPPWQTVYDHFKPFCRTDLCTRLDWAVREAERRRVGR